MLGLPYSTEFNRRIPKKKFYGKLSLSSSVKRAFAEQIRIIYWRNKIAVTTVNLAIGEYVTEIEVFEICLNSPELDEQVLRQIDRQIPYHILFLLEQSGKYRAVIGYKEVAFSGKNLFKVDRYYATDWLGEHELPLHLEGLTLDAVYENFVRQIAGGNFQASEIHTLKESIEHHKRQEHLEKQITALERKIKKERQPKKKFEMVDELRKLQGNSSR